MQMRHHSLHVLQVFSELELILHEGILLTQEVSILLLDGIFCHHEEALVSQPLVSLQDVMVPAETIPTGLLMCFYPVALCSNRRGFLWSLCGG